MKERENGYITPPRFIQQKHTKTQQKPFSGVAILQKTTTSPNTTFQCIQQNGNTHGKWRNDKKYKKLHSLLAFINCKSRRLHPKRPLSG